jgi:hypothetical protein
MQYRVAFYVQMSVYKQNEMLYGRGYIEFMAYVN